MPGPVSCTSCGRSSTADPNPSLESRPFMPGESITICEGGQSEGGGGLFSVLVFQPAGQLVAQLAVIGMDGCSERGLGGTALCQTLEDAREVAHAVGITDIFGCSQGFSVCQSGFGRRQLHKTAFQHVVRYLPFCAEDLG